MPQEQSYSNHARYFPLLHFVLMPLLLLFFLYQSVRMYQEPNLERGIWVVMSILFIVMMVAARLQTLTVQNRVIRLEEKQRYQKLLTGESLENAKKLNLSQIIALRFASDAELAGLIRQVSDGKLTTSKEIKLAIKDWRGDHLRA